jgi:hypothetical protein
MKIKAVETFWVNIPIPPEKLHTSDFGRTVSFDATLARIDPERGLTAWGGAKARVANVAANQALTVRDCLLSSSRALFGDGIRTLGSLSSRDQTARRHRWCPPIRQHAFCRSGDRPIHSRRTSLCACDVDIRCDPQSIGVVGAPLPAESCSRGRFAAIASSRASASGQTRRGTASSEAPGRSRRGVAARTPALIHQRSLEPSRILDAHCCFVSSGEASGFRVRRTVRS